jgi:RNA polymerase sigma-70 factor (ECF subfamily)
MRPAAEERFRSLYADHFDQVLRFARRRTDPAGADDVVAETFLVAWRRLDDVPTRPGEALAWLYAVAHHCLRNAARGNARQRAVAVRLAARSKERDPREPADSVGDRLDVADAWQRLTADEQEVLALSVWEDLTSPQAGTVLGISAAAYRVRLSRARRALARHLDHSPSTAAAAATPSQEPVS